jgi:hypothetical protein
MGQAPAFAKNHSSAALTGKRATTAVIRQASASARANSFVAASVGPKKTGAWQRSQRQFPKSELNTTRWAGAEESFVVTLKIHMMG